MKAICKIDYGQFETNKKYHYSYENNTKKYYVSGDYSKTEFNKRQFDTVFKPERNDAKIQNR